MSIVKSNGYSIIIGGEIFRSISAFLKKNKYSSYFILCDENTLQHCLPKLITSCPLLSSAEIIELESGEASKSLEFSTHIWQTFIENKADKKSLLINLGGGVVSDIGGFTASVYKRGIDFINIPTSLLAMADASVGGKTAIDFNAVKNALGTFAQPKAVFIHPPFLLTLSERHFQNGIGEIYKVALISDKKFWNSLKEGCKTELLIKKSVELKNNIVLKDPFDKGVRNILNFGHTLGHAIESLFLGTEEELLHGEAILIGMIMESHISLQKKMLSKQEFTEIINGLSRRFNLKKIQELPFSAIVELIKNDKKTINTKLRFSLLSKIGLCKFNVEVTTNQIKKAIEYYTMLSK